MKFAPIYKVVIALILSACALFVASIFGAYTSNA